MCEVYDERQELTRFEKKGRREKHVPTPPKHNQKNKLRRFGKALRKDRIYKLDESCVVVSEEKREQLFDAALVVHVNTPVQATLPEVKKISTTRLLETCRQLRKAVPKKVFSLRDRWLAFYACARLRLGLSKDVLRYMLRFCSDERILAIGGFDVPNSKLPFKHAQDAESAASITRHVLSFVGKKKEDFDYLDSLDLSSEMEASRSVRSVDVRRGRVYNHAPLPQGFAEGTAVYVNDTDEVYCFGNALKSDFVPAAAAIFDDPVETKPACFVLDLMKDEWSTGPKEFPAWKKGCSVVFVKGMMVFTGGGEQDVAFVKENGKWKQVHIPQRPNRKLLVKTKLFAVGRWVLCFSSGQDCFVHYEPWECPYCDAGRRAAPADCCSSFTILDTNKLSIGWLPMPLPPKLHFAKVNLENLAIRCEGNKMQVFGFPLYDKLCNKAEVFDFDTALWEDRSSFNRDHRRFGTHPFVLCSGVGGVMVFPYNQELSTVFYLNESWRFLSTKVPPRLKEIQILVP